MAPIEYPTLKIGDKDYTLRLRTSDVMALKKDNLDIFKVKESVETLGVLDFNLRMVRAMIAHQEEMTVEQLAELLDFDRLGQVSKAVNESLKKALDQITADTPKPEIPLAAPDKPPAVQ